MRSEAPRRSTQANHPGEAPRRSIQAKHPGEAPRRSTQAKHPGEAPRRSTQAKHPGEAPATGAAPAIDVTMSDPQIGHTGNHMQLENSAYVSGRLCPTSSAWRSTDSPMTGDWRQLFVPALA